MGRAVGTTELTSSQTKDLKRFLDRKVLAEELKFADGKYGVV